MIWDSINHRAQESWFGQLWYGAATGNRTRSGDGDLGADPAAPESAAPVPPTGGVVYGEHVIALRRQMEAAIAALALFGAVLPSFNYTDPTLPGSPPVVTKLIHL
jgi:hypothetical protein